MLNNGRLNVLSHYILIIIFKNTFHKQETQSVLFIEMNKSMNINCFYDNIILQYIIRSPRGGIIISDHLQCLYMVLF